MGLLKQVRLALSRPHHGPLSVGLVGSGIAMDRIHVPTIRKLGVKFRILGCCSSSPESARQFATEHDIERSYNDIDELLRDPDIDVVVVAVPLQLNAMAAEKVLKAKKHLLIEKPLATSPEEARTLAALARNAGVVAMVAENVLYWPVLEAVKTQLDNDVIGSPSLVVWNSVQHISESSLPEWRTRPSYAHGYLLESGIHLMAGLRYLFGPLRVVQAHAEAIYPGLGHGDFMNATLANEKTSGVSLHFNALLLSIR